MAMQNAQAKSSVLGMPLAFPALQDFLYQPLTTWQGLFQGWFCPHITFGSNIEDKPIESHVLDTVGSYGSQISRIMDAVSVLVAQLEPSALTPQERFTVAKFKELAALADDAVAAFRNRRPSEPVTMAQVAELLDAASDLKRSDPPAYPRIASRIRRWAEENGG
jgi:hypothetical protein